MAEAKLKQIPAKERLCVTYITNSNEFLITRLPDGKFSIYQNLPDGMVRLGRGENPLELESKYVRRNK